MFIEPVPEHEASGAVAELYEADLESDGYVANLTKAFSHRPSVYRAWRELLGSIKADMDPRRYELVTLAAAQALRSSYCSLAHGKILAEEIVGPAVVRDATLARASAGLEPVELAAMDLADKVARDATSVTQHDVDRLRELALDDAEIFDVVAAAAVRCFFSKTLDALGAEPDAAFAGLDPELRDALTVGRPIATP